jgi:hypothetical protein
LEFVSIKIKSFQQNNCDESGPEAAPQRTLPVVGIIFKIPAYLQSIVHCAQKVWDISLDTCCASGSVSFFAH